MKPLIVIGLILLFMLIYFSVTKPNTNVSVGKSTDALLIEIKDKAANYEVLPEDAYMDKIFKKTPGINGRKVNIKKSHASMKKDNVFNEAQLVFDEVAPEVHLKDLPAAPIYRGNPNKNMVAFLINVSWGTEYIPEILKTLKDNNVKATFFIEGKWAKENVESVKMIKEQHHVIGNHAYNHPDMAKITRAEMHKQIDETNEIIEAITEEKPKWFAPPSGSFNDDVVEVAADLEMETILWTVDTVDWQNPSVSVMINRVMENVHPGAMILMHPTDPVAQGLDQLIKAIKEKEYMLGSVDALLDEQR